MKDQGPHDSDIPHDATETRHPGPFDLDTEGAYRRRDSLRHLEIVDDALGLRAQLVIDTEIGGRSCGGLRLLPHIRQGELQDLARTMTFKQVYVGAARGGARAAIECPEAATTARRQQLINRFAELIYPELENRKFLCSRDLGTTAAQIRAMYEHIRMHRQAKPKSGTRSAYFTAVSVMASIQALVKYENTSLKKTRVAVEGFGKVGKTLCQMLTASGAKVVAVSDRTGCMIDEQGLEMQHLMECWDDDAKAWKPGTQSRERPIHAIPSDILVPCADHCTVTSLNAPELNSRFIVAGANNAVTVTAEHLLFDRGVVYLPDFITNSGGVLGNMLEYVGLGEEELFHILRTNVSRDLHWLLRESGARRVPPRTIAIDTLKRKLERMQQSNTKPRRGNAYLSSLAASVLNSPLFPRGALMGSAFRNRIQKGVGME